MNQALDRKRNFFEEATILKNLPSFEMNTFFKGYFFKQITVFEKRIVIFEKTIKRPCRFLKVLFLEEGSFCDVS